LQLAGRSFDKIVGMYVLPVVVEKEPAKLAGAHRVCRAPRRISRNHVRVDTSISAAFENRPGALIDTIGFRPDFRGAEMVSDAERSPSARTLFWRVMASRTGGGAPPLGLGLLSYRAKSGRAGHSQYPRKAG